MFHGLGVLGICMYMYLRVACVHLGFRDFILWVLHVSIWGFFVRAWMFLVVSIKLACLIEL